jgi:hypothetical protein
MGIAIGVTNGKGQWEPDLPWLAIEGGHQGYFGALQEFENVCALSQTDPYGQVLLRPRFYDALYNDALYNDMQRLRVAVARRELLRTPSHIESESGEREDFGWAGLERFCAELIAIIDEAKLREINMIALGD